MPSWYPLVGAIVCVALSFFCGDRFDDIAEIRDYRPLTRAECDLGNRWGRAANALMVATGVLSGVGILFLIF